MNNIIYDIHKAASLLGLNASQEMNASQVCRKYKFASSEYFLNLAKNSEPIRKQVLPDIKELQCIKNSEEDYLLEDQNTKLPGLIHKFGYSALITATENCFMLCRHCTRTRFQKVREQKKIDFDKIFGYISSHKEIIDVLITGGDPLTLSDSQLFGLLDKLNAIQNVKTVRIGTRAPVTYPQRITDNLIAGLSKYKNLWLNTQFNHVDEVTGESIAACAKLIDAGIPVSSQTVILKEINDSTEALKELFLALIEARIRPYYLYQCDYGSGITHFVTHINDSINIYRKLRGEIPGYAIPQLIVDTPMAKIPLPVAKIVSSEGEDATIEFGDKILQYP